MQECHNVEFDRNSIVTKTAEVVIHHPNSSSSRPVLLNEAKDLLSAALKKSDQVPGSPVHLCVPCGSRFSMVPIFRVSLSKKQFSLRQTAHTIPDRKSTSELQSPCNLVCRL